MSAQDAARLAQALTELLDPSDIAVATYETAPGEWTVEIHFSRPPDESAIRGLARDVGGDEAAAALSFEPLATRDWVAASLAGLPPVEAGRFVVHGGHDRHRVRPSRIGIEIEAALAFGTGHHGTTRGCLVALDCLLRRVRPRAILDVGTGTGVLAIAAARALHNPVLASDIDPQAVRVARDNIRINRALPHVTLCVAHGASARRFRERAPFDLIFANILLLPLVQMAATLSRLATGSGHVVLSGLLPTQANAALAAYRAQGLVLRQKIVLDGWATLVMARHGRHP